MLINPRRRKRKATKTRRRRKSAPRAKTVTVKAPVRYARINPKRRKARRVRRNPRALGGILKTGALVEAGIGAAGSIAYDMLASRLPLPANLKTGALGTAVKIGGAFLATKFASKVVGAKTANAVLAGILTVEAVKMLQRFIPGGAVAEYDYQISGPGDGWGDGVGYMGPAPALFSGDDMSAYVPSNMGAYVQ